MRNYIVLLFGSFTLLLATACGTFAPEQRRPEPQSVDYFYFPERAAQHQVQDDTCTNAATQEQVLISQVATRSEELAVPRPHFYTRWRRVHGRWYHFTYRIGKKTSIIYPDSSRQRSAPRLT